MYNGESRFTFEVVTQFLWTCYVIFVLEKAKTIALV
jgi:hypothetical protein